MNMMMKTEKALRPETRAVDSINARFSNFAVHVTGVSDKKDAFFVRMPFEAHATTLPLTGETEEEMVACMERLIAAQLDRMSDRLDAVRRDLGYGERSVWLRVARISPESSVDGSGLRMAVFFQGCPHNCPGCHNPQMHDAEAGTLYTADEIMTRFRKNPLLDGITLSGGEPLSQPAAAKELAARVKEMGKSVVVYTGYEWRQICSLANKCLDVDLLIRNTDMLVDGKYVESMRSPSLPFRGSANQRLIDVQATFTSERGVVLFPETF